MISSIDLQSGPLVCRLREISGRPTTVATECRLTVESTALHISVRAADPDMSALIACAPDDRPAQWIYEEDSLQLAVALDGQAQPDGLMIVNPFLASKAVGRGVDWLVRAERRADGWTIHFGIPLPENTEVIGLSLHRFFRGIRHEVQGLTDALPHPLQPELFTVVRLPVAGDDPSDGLNAADTRFRARATAARHDADQRRLTAARERLAAARPHTNTLLDMKTAIAMARERDAAPVQSNERFLCWNEAHYQHALLNLWELTGSAEWLDRLTARIETVWAQRSCVRELHDGLWKRTLPTWINDSEGDHTACTLVTGVILGPITRMMRLVETRPALHDRRPTIAAWLPACIEALDYHDFEWIDFTDGSGMHLEPYSKGSRRVYPRGGSRINPMNREFFFSMAMLPIARITGNPEYERKVVANARFFRNHCDCHDDCLFWEYEHLGLPATGEDLSHAAAQVSFAMQCHAETIVFTERDLRMMANTLDRHVFRFDDVPCGDLRGFHPGLTAAIGMWSPLCRFVPQRLPAIRTLIAAGIQAREPIYSAQQGWGLRLLTTVELTCRQLENDVGATGY